MVRDSIVQDDPFTLLDALFAHAPVGLGLWDADLRFRRVNTALAEMNGIAPADHIGRRPSELLASATAAQAEEQIAGVLRTGEALVDVAVSGETPAAPGVRRHWRVSYYPVGGADGRERGVVALVVEVTAEHEARSEQQAATALVDAVFAAAPVGVAFWDLGLRYRRVNPALAELNGLAVEEHLGRTPPEVLGELGESIAAVLREVLERGDNAVDREVSGAVRDGEVTHRQVTAFAVVGPDGGPTGVAGVVRDIGAQHEAEAERARLLRDALTARAQAEAAQVRAEAAQAEAEVARGRTEFLALAGARLTAVVTDYDATLQEVARIAVPAIADWCTFVVADPDGTLRTVAVSAADPDDEALAWELDRRHPPRADAPVGAAEAIRSGRSELVPEIHDELIERVAVDDEHLEHLRRLGLRSGLTVPLKVGDRALGALTLMYSTSGRRYGTDDLQLAETLAARAALNVENARLYAERSHIARTLQRSLMPPAPPEIPGVEIASRYRAAGDENEVGGDFYDVFRGPDHAWRVVIGDVVGKGAEAAAVTSLTRHTLRAAAHVSSDPRANLRLLNDALLDEPGVAGRFCTVLLARLDAHGPEGLDLVLATGGHLPPRIVAPGGEVRQADLRGAIVGGLREAEFGELAARLAPGELLVLFTDGVTELRGRPPGTGEQALDELLAAMGGVPPEEVAEAVVRHAVELQGGVPRDDVAVLVVCARA